MTMLPTGLHQHNSYMYGTAWHANPRAVLPLHRNYFDDAQYKTSYLLVCTQSVAPAVLHCISFQQLPGQHLSVVSNVVKQCGWPQQTCLVQAGSPDQLQLCAVDWRPRKQPCSGDLPQPHALR